MKIIMKRIPKKVEPNTRHDVLRGWSSAITENNDSIVKMQIISAREITSKRAGISHADKKEKELR